MFGSRVSQATINRRQHIPEHAQQAINQHLQRSLPGNLKHYLNGNGHVPLSARRAIADHLQSSMPAHLQKYADAYAAQKIMRPSLGLRPAMAGSSSTAASIEVAQPHPPAPDVMRQDHPSSIASEQAAARLQTDWFTSDAPATARATVIEPQAPQPESPEPNGPILTPQPPTPPEQSPYDFITEPPKPRRGFNFSFLNGASFGKRIAIVLGGGAALLILFYIFASIFIHGPPTAGLISLTQQQNELIGIAKTASEQAVQQDTKNLAMTIQLSLTTNQDQLLIYLKKIGTKVSSKQLVATDSSTITKELANAQSVSNFDTVYVQITQNQLTTYAQNLKHVFDSTSNAQERKLLSQQYSGAALLLKQANAAGGSS